MNLAGNNSNSARSFVIWKQKLAGKGPVNAEGIPTDPISGLEPVCYTLAISLRELGMF